jgi:hypothetical protein
MLAGANGIADLFEGFSAKPDIVIDDMPGTCVAPFVYNLGREGGWLELATGIIEKHIDWPELWRSWSYFSSAVKPACSK